MSTAIEARRPGMKAWLTLIRCEAKMVARDTAGLVVPIGLPLLILVMSASSAGDEVVSNGRTALDLFVLPLVLTMVIATVGIINMPSFLAYYRRTGILRRLSVTPASPSMVLIAQVIVSVIQTVIGLTVAVAVAFLGFGANLPAHLGTAVGVYLLAMAAMYAVGMIVAAIAPTPNSAVAIGLVTFFAFGALGGMFGGPDSLPDVLASIGEWLPFGAAVDALAAAWVGAAVEASQLISLGATTVLGAVIAAVFFRWD
ncbi:MULTISPECIES: ABC transporter permease [Actinoalloteichus]|uniref:Transport permease protein n=1 Tax=Actinoalloteichus fjordicus TaxID=1612552 RepID=A0AAC9LGT7_9PSEU|nr:MULTISPECIES: ABC transporter permease [Actinoalloteichus]APU17431.1 ABC-type multidrug transport system, permease component [Actinoalloteichus fjordicus]APU23517.1 ABC-type multidrug transport system, permease component [Actinoalloteichus sp. GBA129-24]